MYVEMPKKTSQFFFALYHIVTKFVTEFRHKTTLWRTSVTIFRHKLWRNGKAPSQFCDGKWRNPSQNCDGFRHNFPGRHTTNVKTPDPPPKIVTDFPSQFPSQMYCDGKSPSQFPSQTYCDGLNPSQIVRHKILWRNFCRHNVRHKLWRTRHNFICDEWNCDGQISVIISVTNCTFSSQIQEFSVTISVTNCNFFRSNSSVIR